jgi:hypothetical protein
LDLSPEFQTNLLAASPLVATFVAWLVPNSPA